MVGGKEGRYQVGKRKGRKIENFGEDREMRIQKTCCCWWWWWGGGGGEGVSGWVGWGV